MAVKPIAIVGEHRALKRQRVSHRRDDQPTPEQRARLRAGIAEFRAMLEAKYQNSQWRNAPPPPLPVDQGPPPEPKPELLDVLAISGRSRDRATRGQHLHKLTDEHVYEIRASKDPINVLADRYGLWPSTVYDIVTRKTWKHLLPREDDNGLSEP